MHPAIKSPPSQPPRVSSPPAARRPPLLPPLASTFLRSLPLPAKASELFPRAHSRFLAARYFALSPHSPEPEPQQARRRDLAATTCRGHLRSEHHHQSTCGEPNHTPTPHVSLFRPPFAAGEPTRRREGICVRISILPRALVQRRGSFERL
jgi:hypothetical protein